MNIRSYLHSTDDLIILIYKMTEIFVKQEMFNQLISLFQRFTSHLYQPRTSKNVC